MIAAAAIDNRGGMMFYGKRLSSDRALRKYLYKLLNEKKLYCSEYTARQFADAPEGMVIAGRNFKEAGCGDVCFFEDEDPNEYAGMINKIILFRWNRDYPADTFWNINMKEWEMVSSVDIKGHSHEKITVDAYMKKENGPQ